MTVGVRISLYIDSIRSNETACLDIDLSQTDSLINSLSMSWTLKLNARGYCLRYFVPTSSAHL